MSSMTALPRSRPLTRADLATMPDDGHRYELIDGTLIVSPAPVRLHQRVVSRLLVVLDDACPPELEVLTAPFDIVLDELTVLQPDLLVARNADFTPRDLPTAPLLAVEVLSPSTRRIDLLVKRSRLEAAGCPSYWVVDPHEDPDEARLIAWELRQRHYEQVADVAGEQAWASARPFPVDIVPARLVAPRR